VHPKSADYFEKICKLKLKWATCYTPQVFTAGIHTTSRIESINAVIKQYVNSNSEISNILDFMVAFEEKLQIKNEIEEEKSVEEIHPVLKILKTLLSKYIFKLHHEQHILSYRYLIDPNDLSLSNFENSQPSFRVKSIDSKDQEHFRMVRLIENKYMCECETYIQCGIICRHIFYVSHMRQEKDLSCIKINFRWLIKDEIETKSIKELFEEFLENEKSKSEKLSKDFEEEKDQTNLEDGKKDDGKNDEKGNLNF